MENDEREPGIDEAAKNRAERRTSGFREAVRRDKPRDETQGRRLVERTFLDENNGHRAHLLASITTMAM